MNVKKLKQMIENLPNEMVVVLKDTSKKNPYLPLDGEVYSIQLNVEDTLNKDMQLGKKIERSRKLILYTVS